MSERKNKIVKVLGVSFAHFSHDSFMAFLAPILPLLIAKFGLTYSMAALIGISRNIPTLFNPVIGSVADRYNLKFFVILGPALSGVFMLSMGIAPNFAVLLLLGLGASISSAIFHIPCAPLIKKFAGNKMGFAMSIYMIGGESARALGPIIALTVVSIFGLSGMYKVLPICILIAFIIFMALRDIPYIKPTEKHSVKGSILETITHGKLFFIAIFGVFLTKIFTASLTGALLPTYLVSEGHSAWMGGICLSITQISAIFGLMFSGYLADKYGRLKILTFIIICAPLTMLGWLFAESIFTNAHIFGGDPQTTIQIVKMLFTSGWYFILSLFIFGVVAYADMPIYLSLVQSYGFKFPATANGVFFMAHFFLSSIGVFMAGRMSDILSMHTAFRIFAGISFLGILFIPLLRKAAKRADIHAQADANAELIRSSR